MEPPGPSDIRHLRTFLAVAELGSFTRAATLLNLTQQAVSIHVKRLEANLRVTLFSRTTRKVVLTNAGHRLVAEAGDLLRRLDDLWCSSRADIGDPVGTVRVGTSTAAAHEFAPDLVEMVGRDLPRIEIALSEMNPIDVFGGITDGTLDLGMTLEPPGGHGLGGIRLASGTLAPVLARSLDPTGDRQFVMEDLRSMTLFIPSPEDHPHLHQCALRFAARERMPRTTTAITTNAMPKSVFCGTAFALWPTVLPERFVPAGLTVLDISHTGARGRFLAFVSPRACRAGSCRCHYRGTEPGRQRERVAR